MGRERGGGGRGAELSSALAPLVFSLTRARSCAGFSYGRADGPELAQQRGRFQYAVCGVLFTHTPGVFAQHTDTPLHTS